MTGFRRRGRVCCEIVWLVIMNAMNNDDIFDRDRIDGLNIVIRERDL